MNLQFKILDASNYQDAILIKAKPEQTANMESVSDILKTTAEMREYQSLIVYDNQTPIAFVQYGAFGDNPDVWLDEILVGDAFQHKGYGSAIIEYMLSYLAHLYQTRYIYLSVFDFNMDAIRLYEKLGFIKTNEKDSLGESVYLFDMDSYEK